MALVCQKRVRENKLVCDYFSSPSIQLVKEAGVAQKEDVAFCTKPGRELEVAHRPQSPPKPLLDATSQNEEKEVLIYYSVAQIYLYVSRREPVLLSTLHKNPVFTRVWVNVDAGKIISPFCFSGLNHLVLLPTSYLIYSIKGDLFG